LKEDDDDSTLNVNSVFGLNYCGLSVQIST